MAPISFPTIYIIQFVQKIWNTKCINSHFTEVRSKWPSSHLAIIGSGRGFVNNRQQAITWTYDDPDRHIYRKTSNISRILVGNKIVGHSDVVGASPVGAAPTTSSFLTQHLASRDSAKTAARQDKNLLNVEI